MRTILMFVAVILIVSGVYAFTAHHPYTPQDSTVVKVSTSTVSGQAGPANLYPNAYMTPGAILTDDAAVVCKSGYSKSVRDVPVSEKKQVYAEYGIKYPQPTGSYEVDHFISLELGGSNDISNLWPEPANPVPGFHEKDKVENYLHDQVCGGDMTLQSAQNLISNDWYAVYLRITGHGRRL